MTREEKYIEYDGLIDRYLRNLMDDEERKAFEQDVDNNQELRERLVDTALLAQGIAQAGMQREGQAQLDAIRQMSREEFKRAAGIKGRKPIWTLTKWAASIAAIAVVAFGVYTYYPSGPKPLPEVTQTITRKPAKPQVEKTPTEPTLASLADEYNTPFGNEPEEFTAISQQIKAGDKELMAVIEDIDNIAWPTAINSYKGADDEEDIKYTTDNFNDCTHWFKALAYLKADDKEGAVKELEELAEHGLNEDLIERATALLEKLKQ